MKEDIDFAINEYIKQIKEVDTNNGTASIVKAIDKATQEIYRKLYNIKGEFNRKNLSETKHGHCC